MPSIKHRQRVMARSFISSSPLYLDAVIPWERVFVSASAVSIAGSIAAYQVSGSLSVLRFTGTSNTSYITVSIPIPQNAAQRGDTAAAGSGTLYADWTTVTGDSKVVAVTASLWSVPNGSAITDVGTCTLGTAASGTTMTGTGASELVSTSLMDFNAPNTRNGQFVLKFSIDSKDAGNTSGSDFGLLGFRLRYAADRIGS